MRIVAMAMLITLIPATERPGNRIMVVLDVSGSMSANGRIEQAIAMVKEITRQPVDDGFLSAIAFDIGASRYPGGWVALPGEESVAEIENWLSSQLIGGGTRVCPALVKALSEPHKGLTVIIVSDGLFNEEGDAQIISCIESMQAKRVSAGLGKAVIGVLGVRHKEEVPSLAAIAKNGRGGYYVTGE